MKSVAFFDFDKTLIAGNSANLWLRSQWQKRELSRMQIIRAFTWLMRYQLGLSNVERGIEQAIRTLRGFNEKTFRQRIEEFYEKDLRHLYRPGAIKALNEHRENGDRIVLLSSVHHHLAELVTKELQLDDYLCTTLEVDPTGAFTGQTVGPICFGSGKVVFAKQFLALEEFDLSQCAFYTDSFTDLPVLEIVGKPMVVNPDPRLKRYARSRQWKVEDWGEP